MVNKTIFSRTELNKFLLLSDPGDYLIDKINPSVRAVKRKEMLSIFCTLRVKKNTTSVKLGEFPKNNLDEIYSKLKVVKKISTNGNNPNIVLSSIIKKYDSFKETKLNNLSFENLTEIFFDNKKKLSDRYKKDLMNCLRKNLGKHFLNPVKTIKKQAYLEIIKNISKSGKLGTIKSFVYKINTISNFFILKENLDCSDQLKEFIALTPLVTKKYLIKQKKNRPLVGKICKEIKFLGDSELSKVYKTILRIKNG